MGLGVVYEMGGGARGQDKERRRPSGKCEQLRFQFLNSTEF